MCYLEPHEIIEYLGNDGYTDNDFWWSDFSKDELRQVANLIINGKTDLLMQKDSAGTPFFPALFEDEKNYSVAEYILENVDVDVNMRDEYGNTPLHLVAMNSDEDSDDLKNCEMAEILIKCGADVNAKNNFGWIPLYHAIVNYSYGKGSLIELLIRAGSNLCTKDIYGKTIYDYIIDEAYYETTICFYRSVRLKIKLEDILKHSPVSKIEVEMYDLKEIFIKIYNSKGEIAYNIILKFYQEDWFIKLLEKNLHKLDFKNDRFEGEYEEFEKFIKNKQ